MLDEQKAMFKKSNGSMKSHLKPLFIQAKVDDIGLTILHWNRFLLYASPLQPFSITRSSTATVDTHKTREPSDVFLLYFFLSLRLSYNLFQF